ncbi:hypothetical protein AB0L53_13130 [Nonomuraea sp. NPDC052129]|uniref:hypothetical protein n=1 Tax=Nonomuraea sp. NPDC052129 TaxID=3154651 RepID=UPI003415C03F
MTDPDEIEFFLAHALLSTPISASSSSATALSSPADRAISRSNKFKHSRVSVAMIYQTCRRIVRARHR